MWVYVCVGGMGTDLVEPVLRNQVGGAKAPATCVVLCHKYKGCWCCGPTGFNRGQRNKDVCTTATRAWPAARANEENSNFSLRVWQSGPPLAQPAVLSHWLC